MRFAIAALAAVCAFAFGADARQFQSALFSEEVPSEVMLQDMFTAFMKQYSKAYSHAEFSSRFNQFKANVETIRLHNTLANASYTMGLNEFADLSFEEFKGKYFGYKHVEREFARSNNLHQEVEAAPTSIDWRTSNAVTPIKDQGQCGSCWAFSATGSIEGAWVLQGKHTLTSLSEQQLVDCSTSYGDAGCNGGLMDYAFEYIIANKGICAESAYPYKGVGGLCQKSCTKVVTISGYKDVASGDEASLLNAVGTVGPVSVAIEADQAGFQFYSSGVFSGTCGHNLDHGVLAVGYGTTGSQDYWIVKNSWGTSWGESGYIRMIRNKNQCGIAIQPSYPTV
uniref:Cysteine protease 1 n=1 Tax=Brachiaria hybrid cultivar TaxID=680201 RepID=D0ES72_9POAL|nr:cysteine protease 1 [Brachiaria hybrid cultivar]